MSNGIAAGEVVVGTGISNKEESNIVLSCFDARNLSRDDDKQKQQKRENGNLDDYRDSDGLTSSLITPTSIPVSTSAAGIQGILNENLETASLSSALQKPTIPASLQKRIVKTKICVHYLSGRCTRASKCLFAHSKEELRQPPNLYKTRLCINFMSNKVCSEGHFCRFAHGEAELRWTPEFYKTSLCPYWQADTTRGCCAGDHCRWAHGLRELRQRNNNNINNNNDIASSSSSSQHYETQQSYIKPLGTGETHFSNMSSPVSSPVPCQLKSLSNPASPITVLSEKIMNGSFSPLSSDLMSFPCRPSPQTISFISPHLSYDSRDSSSIGYNASPICDQLADFQRSDSRHSFRSLASSLALGRRTMYAQPSTVELQSSPILSDPLSDNMDMFEQIESSLCHGFSQEKSCPEYLHQSSSINSIDAPPGLSRSATFFQRWSSTDLHDHAEESPTDWGVKDQAQDALTRLLLLALDE